eukprot:6213056-Pleurochrysis_carterae.AAC.3
MMYTHTARMQPARENFFEKQAVGACVPAAAAAARDRLGHHQPSTLCSLPRAEAAGGVAAATA